MKIKKTIIIAEIGVNHNGILSNAFKLILAAKKAGADYVKFQTFDPEEMTTSMAKKAPYQINNKSKDSQKKMLEKFTFSKDDYLKIVKFCHKKKINFLSTAFDIKSLDLLNTFKLDFYKIPSGEIDNVPLLKKIGKLNKKVILSTGMADTKDIKTCLEILKKNGQKLKKIIILHCTTSYPTPIEDVNLKSLLYLKDYFKNQVGLSDHTQSTMVPAFAVAMGAVLIEKHLTLNKKMNGPDHKSSLNPNEFIEMVNNIRSAELSLGIYKKFPTKKELLNKKFTRKSIVAKKNIAINETLSESNITTKRPGTGISAKNWEIFLGKKAKKKISKDEFINFKNTYAK